MVIHGCGGFVDIQTTPLSTPERARPCSSIAPICASLKNVAMGRDWTSLMALETNIHATNDVLPLGQWFTEVAPRCCNQPLACQLNHRAIGVAGCICCWDEWMQISYQRGRKMSLFSCGWRLGFEFYRILTGAKHICICVFLFLYYIYIYVISSLWAFINQPLQVATVISHCRPWLHQNHPISTIN